MRTLRLLPGLLTFLLLTACVTINVYFPAVAAEKAADRIIEDVWGRDAEPAEDDREQPPADDQQSAVQPERGLDREVTAWAMRTLEWLVQPAYAQQPDIDVSSPAIRRITQSMEQRHQQLKPYYDSGAVGLTGDALIEVRDQGAVPLRERNQVRQLVADENTDRDALYREIALANKRPEWEDEIRKVFAERWIAKARPGWYYQNASGGWQQK